MICLTFDTDYMSDEDMRRFLDAFPPPGRGTFFVHRRFARVPWGEHEIEPHPFLAANGPWEAQLDAFVADLGIVPKGLRSHSCVYSQQFGVSLHARGYVYASMATPLHQAGLAPYRHPWGIWEVPIYYMDNMDYCMPDNWPGLHHVPFRRDLIDEAVAGDALYVFDFHPLHVALNTRSMRDYQPLKPRLASGAASPFDLAQPGDGVRSFYLDLCRAMDEAGVASRTCLEAVDAFRAAAATGSLGADGDGP